MPSVSRTGGVSPTPSVSYNNGTINKGSGVTNGGGSVSPSTFNITTELGDPITTESGSKLVTENAQ